MLAAQWGCDQKDGEVEFWMGPATAPGLLVWVLGELGSYRENMSGSWKFQEV